MKSFTKTIPAGGSSMDVWPGKVLSVKSCSSSLTVCFDGQDSDTSFKSGRIFNYKPGGFRTVNLTNPNASAVTVTYYIGDEPVAYQADDNSGANAQSYALGNLGIAISAAAGGGLPACDANGFLQITNAMALVIPGTNLGHRRQIVTFSMSSASAASLNVLDANGNAFVTLAAGDKYSITTDASLILSGAGGVASCTVGEIYLNA